MVLVVEFTFESVNHVINLGEPGALQRLARFERTVAAAADEHDRSRGVIGAGELPYLADEMRIDLPVRAVIPRDMQRPQRMTDEQVLHLAAAVDQQRIGVRLQEIVRLPRLEVSHRGAIICRKRLTPLGFVGHTATAPI